MKKVTKDILKQAANNLMFDMDETQYDTLLDEFQIISSQMELVCKVPNIDDVKPMTFPYEINTKFLRKDIPSKPLTSDDALKNAKDVVDGQIRIPKVIN